MKVKKQYEFVTSMFPGEVSLKRDKSCSLWNTISIYSVGNLDHRKVIAGYAAPVQLSKCSWTILKRTRMWRTAEVCCHGCLAKLSCSRPGIVGLCPDQLCPSQTCACYLLASHKCSLENSQIDVQHSRQANLGFSFFLNEGWKLVIWVCPGIQKGFHFLEKEKKKLEDI